MRPIELGLENFRSYFGAETVFSFRGRTLVGIVGPIGAGKSTILDAVAFALFGKTPTVAAATRSLIHQRASDAMVRLRFEVDGQIWEAVRRLREKGQSQHALYRYAEDGSGLEPVERITMEADVNTRIVELLGLEFDAFGRSVLLAQNRFAEFLRARPAERDKVLKGVFGHDRLDVMREAAKVEAAARSVELEKLEVRVEALERLATRLSEQQVALAALEQRLEALQKAEPVVTALDAAIAESGEIRREAEQRLTELRQLAEGIPEEAATSQLFADAEHVEERRRELATTLESAQAELAAAEQALADHDDAGIPTSIEQAASLLAALVPLDKAADEAARRLAEVKARRDRSVASSEAARGRLTSAASTAERAEADVVGRVAELEAAESHLHEVRHAEMAITLRAGLVSGEPCPVCAQEVIDVPAVDAPADLASATEAHGAARSARQRAEAIRVKAAAELQAATEALAAVEGEAVRLGTELEAAAGAAVEAERSRDETAAELERLVGAGDPGDQLRRIRAESAALHDRQGRARKAVERARSNHDSAIREQQEIGKRLSSLQVDLARLVTKLDVSIDLEDDTPATLRQALERLRQAWSDLSRDLTQQGAQASAAETSARRELAEAFTAVGIDGDFRTELTAVATGVEMTAAALLKDQEELARGEELIAARDELAAAHVRYQQIASDLTDSRFVRYLLDDERTRLAALGSDHFERLSSGRYRFNEDGKFDIVDLTAADAVRKADSLSGGETFLASLALALALAEMVARTGGRLDAFFIDEGFGSLDPEHLDLAMEGIEALVADGPDRLVVVVSHVPELRHRVEDLIELDRNPTTGDTRVVRS